MKGTNSSDNKKQGRTTTGKPFDICDRTFQFALRIVSLCSALDHTPGVNWPLSKQLLRSGTSIGANVDEAQAGQSRADFISKYSIARKEVRETIYWLRLISASHISNHPDIPPLIVEAQELHKVITSIIRNTKGLK